MFCLEFSYSLDLQLLAKASAKAAEAWMRVKRKDLIPFLVNVHNLCLYNIF